MGASSVPDSPADALAEVLATGVGWLARTDLVALALLSSQLDERDALADSSTAGSTEGRRALQDLDRQVVALLSVLGFTPSARARLGVAEVTSRSKVDEIRERQRDRK